MLNYEFPPIGGGGGLANLNLLRHYAADDRISIDLLTSSPSNGSSIELFAPNITIHKIGITKKDLQHWTRLEVISWLGKAWGYYRQLLRTGGHDLAHAFFAFPTGYLCWARRRLMPYVISLRGSDVPGQHARLRVDYIILGPLMRAIWRQASCIVANSRGLKVRALRFLPTADILVIPNGVDLNRFKPGPVMRADSSLMLLMVGRLSVTKRIGVLVEAIKLLRESGLDVRLTIAGGGPMELEVRKLVAARGLTGIVEVKGMVSHDLMPEIYRSHDIFVTATSQEGMSNAMLEAMASGLPIVTTYCEGVDELIADNGIVVHQARPENLAAAIMELASDRDRLVAMSLAARRRALMFSWAEVARQYLELYQRILAGCRTSRAGSEG